MQSQTFYNNPNNSSPSGKHLKTQQEELSSLTHELQSHFLGKYFVDPDKTFLSLLQKLMKFFDNNELLSSIKENEHLYLNFRSKYQEALDWITTLGDEKDKLSMALRNAKNNQRIYPSTISSKKEEKSYYDDENLNIASPSFNKSNPISYKNNSNLSSNAIDYEIPLNNKRNKCSIKISEFNPVNEIGHSMSEYDKLKEEYLTVLNEKKELEDRVLLLSEECEKHENLETECSALREENEKWKIRNEDYSQEMETMAAQIERFKIDKDNLLNDLTAWREGIKLCESEKTEIKIKNAHHLSKFKNMEKEIINYKKKNTTLTNNIKSLLEKVTFLTEDKEDTVNNYEEKLQDLENKICSLEAEKQRICKDTLSIFIENAMQKTGKNKISFSYDLNKKLITVRYQNEIIGVVADDSTETKQKNSLIKSPFNIGKEISVNHYRQLTCKQPSYINDSQSKVKQDIELRNTPFNKTNVSLNKLFGGEFSISSKLSLENDLSINDKENNANAGNLNLIQLNTNSFAEKMVMSSSVKATEVQNEILIKNCINQISLTKDNFTFTKEGSTCAKGVVQEKQKKNAEFLICSSNNFGFENGKEAKEAKDTLWYQVDKFNFSYLSIKIRTKRVYLRKAEDKLKTEASYYNDNYLGNENKDVNEITTESDVNNWNVFTAENNEKWVNKGEEAQETPLKRGTCCQCSIF